MIRRWTHYADPTSVVAACGAEDGYQSWVEEEVTCPDCKAEIA